jgi:hypothetical protein
MIALGIRSFALYSALIAWKVRRLERSSLIGTSLAKKIPINFKTRIDFLMLKGEIAKFAERSTP